MASLEIEVDFKALDAFMKRFDANADRALDAAAQSIVNDIVQSFGKSPPGVEYGNYVASQPGYPPNVDTGALRGSMHWQRSGNLEREIMDGVEYGAKLELGIGVGARPFVSPAFRGFSKRVGQHFRGYLDE
ncbi:MAG: HK97 gp10 family phage protein [Aggregatilineales bacterium]